MNKQLPDNSEEIQIQIEAVARAEVPEAPDPADDDNRRLIKLGQPGDRLRVFMSYPCLKQMLAHIQRHLDCEVGGVFLGAIGRSRLGLVTTMTEALPAVRTEAGRGHITFSHDSWEEIYSYLDSLAENLQIVGWYHTHPGFGVFFSHQDSFIQENFFGHPGQLGVVIDPVKRILAAFCCADGELEALAGLWISATDDTYAIAQQLAATLQYSTPGAGRGGWLQTLGRPVHRLLKGEKQ